jgi:glycosyltransferase involved in cell wall biosynthesis
MYGTWLKNVRVVHNSRDPRTFWSLDKFVIKLIDKYGLLEKDIVSVYPLSTPRMVSGKGLDKAIKLHSKLKELGYKTCLIVPNAHANAERDKQQISQTLSWATDKGLSNTDLLFTSLEDAPTYEGGVSPKIISDLFRIANVFVFPTTSENCSLVLLEALLAGNLLVLNRNVRSLSEFGRNEALYFDFNYRTPDEVNERYYLDLAKILASQFENNKSLQAKRNGFQKHSYDFVFKSQIEPLLFEED